MWGSFLVKKNDCKNLTKWILLAHHVQGLLCILQTCENYQKVGFISKHIKPFDNLMLTLKSHHSGDMHRAIHDLWPYFHKEHAHHSLGI